jgi:hypothetical protein
MAQTNDPVSNGGSPPATTLRSTGDIPDVQPASGFKLSQSVVILGALVLVVGGALLLLQLFVARRLPEMTEARFEAAQSLWETNGPKSYDMDIDITGAQPGKVHIEVRDGTPTAMTRDGRAPDQRTWATWTVPGMFRMLVDEFAIKEDPAHKGQGPPGAEVWLRAEFDLRYGYPRTYQRIFTGGGPQVEWHVTRFEPK